MPHGKFGRLGRPATDCQRPGWETRVTPRLHHCLLTSPVTVCRTAVSWHFLYVDSATPWPDTRDATPPGCSWYRPLSTPYCLYPAGADHWQYRCQRICWQAALGLLRLFVCSWYDSAFLCVCGGQLRILGWPGSRSRVRNVSNMHCLSCVLCCAWGGGGVGSTVPVEGGVVFPPLRFLSMYTFA